MTMNFKVRDCLKEDAGKGIARIHEERFREFNFQHDEIIIIEVPNTSNHSYARIHDCREGDENLNSIWLDSCLRKNIGVGLGSEVKIRKSEAKIAKSIEILPLDEDGDFTSSQLVTDLNGRVVGRNDYVIFYKWGKHEFKILNCFPENTPVIIKQTTNMVVKEKRKINPEVSIDKINKFFDEIIVDDVSVDRMKRVFDEIIEGDKVIIGDPEKAIQHYQNANNFYTDHIKNVNIITRLASAHINLGKMTKVRGEFYKAYDFYREVLSTLKIHKDVIRENIKNLAKLLHNE